MQLRASRALHASCVHHGAAGFEPFQHAAAPSVLTPPAPAPCVTLPPAARRWMNLIPWNPVYQPQGPFYDAPGESGVVEFGHVLRTQYGILCSVRQEKGQDIAGARR